MYLLSAVIIGLMGSLHCVGMCGPLMLVAHSTGNSAGRIPWKSLLLYQSGRILTYALLGLLFGTLGWGIYLFGFQREIAIITGCLLLLIVGLNLDAERQITRIKWFGKFQFWLRSTFGRLLKNNSSATRFSLGILNGLLPCGLVYLAILGAVNAPGAGWGMLYMICFGLGTLPLLLISLYYGHRLSGQLQKRLRGVQNIVLIIAAVLLIWRGGSYQVPAEFWNFQDLVFPPMCH